MGVRVKSAPPRARIQLTPEQEPAWMKLFRARLYDTLALAVASLVDRGLSPTTHTPMWYDGPTGFGHIVAHKRQWHVSYFDKGLPAAPEPAAPAPPAAPPAPRSAQAAFAF